MESALKRSCSDRALKIPPKNIETLPASIAATPANRIRSMLTTAPLNPVRKARFVTSPSARPRAEAEISPLPPMCACLST